MFDLKAWWAKITAPYEDEKWEEYQEAASIVCGHCWNPGLYCEECPVMTERPRIRNKLLGGKQNG